MQAQVQGAHGQVRMAHKPETEGQESPHHAAMSILSNRQVTPVLVTSACMRDLFLVSPRDLKSSRVHLPARIFFFSPVIVSISLNFCLSLLLGYIQYYSPIA